MGGGAKQQCDRAPAPPPGRRRRRGSAAARRSPLGLGFGRLVASETEAPNMFANLG
jgi:hypothetical protein